MSSPLLLVIAALTAGCGTAAVRPPAAATASKPVHAFPSRTELAALPSAKPSAEAFGADAVTVDEWTFESPSADQADEAGTAYDDPSPWGALLREVVKAHGGAVVLSPALRCAASEIGRAAIKRGGTPAESFRRFTVARCGASAPNTSAMVYLAKAPLKMTDAQIFAQFEAEARKVIASGLGRERSLVGLAAVREGESFAFTMVVGVDEVKLEPDAHRIGDDRRVVVRGTLRGEASPVFGWINQGRYAVAPCESDPNVAPPRFAITCRAAESDAAAWISIATRRSGRLLLTNVADILAFEGDSAKLTYQAHSYGPAAPVKTPAQFSSALLDRLNRVRAAAKMGRVSLATRQSAENTRLAGTLIESASGDGVRADKIALGLLAGWEVDGLIHTGEFFVARTPSGCDAGAWLDFSLERPLGRMSLLNPASRQVGIGATIPEGANAVGAAVTTYSFFEAGDHAADVKRLLARLAKERARVGAAATTRFASVDLTEQARLVRDREKPPMAAVNDAIEAVATKTGSAVGGWVLEGSDIDGLPLPRELLAPGPLSFAVEVTHHRAPGAAWGQLVVLVVTVGVTPQQVTDTTL